MTDHLECWWKIGLWQTYFLRAISVQTNQFFLKSLMSWDIQLLFQIALWFFSSYMLGMIRFRSYYEHNYLQEYTSNIMLIPCPSEWHIMTKKSGSQVQPKMHKCTVCDYSSKQHVLLVLHCKEEHDIKLWLRISTMTDDTSKTLMIKELAV